MKLSRRRFLTITAATAAVATAGSSAVSGRIARWKGIALGAKADIRLLGLSSSKADTLLEVARHEILRLERIFSLYQSDSELTGLNASGRLLNPGPDMLALLTRVSAIHSITGGRFDPTVQPLWKAYAESGNDQPDHEAVKNARASIGWNRVELSSDEIRLPQGGALTLNGIAQGYITDRITDLLREEGLENALVEVGEISALGTSPDDVQGWSVRLGDIAGPKVLLRNQAVATSAPAATLIGDGRSHILDPLTGMPTKPDWLNLSAIHHSAAVADGISTAAVLMKPEELEELPSRLPGLKLSGQHSVSGRIGYYS